MIARRSLVLLLPILVSNWAAAATNHPAPGQMVDTRATGVMLSNVSSVEDACGGVRYTATLTATGTTNDGNNRDTIWFQIFDDQIEKFAQSFSIQVGQTQQFLINAEYPGAVGNIAPGIGIYVSENRAAPHLLVIDPFFPTPIAGCSIGGAAPGLAYTPNTGTTIAYSAAGAAAPITISNAGGGSGSGPVATTTLTNCTFAPANPAFPTAAFNPAVSAIGTGAPNPTAFTPAGCVPQAAAVNATLTCVEQRGFQGTNIQRSWPVVCPAAAVAVAPPQLRAPVVEAFALGGGLPNGNSQAPVLSRTGGKMAYTSNANNIVAGVTGTTDDIYLRDRISGTTTRISALAAALNPGVQEAYVDPAISAEGNAVVFTGSSGQVYAARDGVGRRVSSNAQGVMGNAESGRPAPSADGALVFFDSTATNLLAGNDANGAMSDIFVKDLNSDAVILISRGPNGEAANGPSFAPATSADGQTIVFSSRATNIVPTSAPVAYSENFDGVSAPALPSGWTATNAIAGNGVLWRTTAAAAPPAVSLPNALEIDAESVITDKRLDSPSLRVLGTPASVTFQRIHNIEQNFDGLVLEISINGSSFVDALTAGGTFPTGGYNGTISSQFGSPIAGRSAWTGATGAYVPTTYTLPPAVGANSLVRLRFRIATDSSVGGAGARIDSIASSNLVLQSSTALAFPDQTKQSTIQQAMMMRGGGFGQSRLYLSRNLNTGELGNGDSSGVQVSADGRWGVFQSNASNLVAGDTNSASDIFRFEIANNQLVDLRRVSVSKSGEQANGDNFNPQISDDGLLVVFETLATNLAPPDTNGQPDVVMKSMLTGDVVRVLAPDGSEPNGLTVLPTISGDGSTLGFCTLATNVAPGDTNNAADVFSSEIDSGLPRDEPGVIRLGLPAPNPPNANCPAGYFIAAITDGPGVGISPGIFGMELLLDEPGTRRLEGGLNFGGLVDAGQAGFAGVNIDNPANENQRLNVSLRGSPSADANGALPVRIEIIRQTLVNGQVVNQTVFESNANLSLAQATTSSVVVPPGYYVATVSPTGTTPAQVGGAPEGQFFFELSTSFVDRPGGGFQGGAVVGGYHAQHPFGGVSGFAAFCLGSTHSTSVRVLSQPSYGPSGARDLRLRILDGEQRVIVSIPGG